MLCVHINLNINAFYRQMIRGNHQREEEEEEEAATTATAREEMGGNKRFHPSIMFHQGMLGFQLLRALLLSVFNLGH